MKHITQKYFFLLFSIIISSCSSLESDGDKYCNMLNEFSNKVYDELKEAELSKFPELVNELQKEFIDETKEITDKYNQEEFSTYFLENCDLKLGEIIQKAMKDAKDKKVKERLEDIEEQLQEEEKKRIEFDEYLNSLIKNIPESCDEIKNNLYGSDAYNCVENETILKERNLLKISITEESLILFDDQISDLNYINDMIVNFIDNGRYNCDYCRGVRDPQSSDSPEKATIVLRSRLGRSAADANTERRILKDILGAYFMLRDSRYNELYSDDDLSYREILMKYSFENIPNKYYQRILRVNSEYPMNFLFKKGTIKPDDLDYTPPPSSLEIIEVIEIIEDEEEVEVEETIIESTETDLAEIEKIEGNTNYKFSGQDFYIIAEDIASSEEEAKRLVEILEYEGFEKTGYLWIPDYKSLSGAEYYSVFIGPFLTIDECALEVERYRKSNPSAYGLLVSNKSTERVEIRGPGKITRR